MITSGSNPSSLMAQNSLAKTTEALSRTFERLASGLRINHASDDPGGLAMSQTLQADSRVLTQAIRNVNDGISTVNVAEAALEELMSITTRQKELATQAATGSYSLTQRQSMNAEANSLVDEFNRIVNNPSTMGIISSITP